MDIVISIGAKIAEYTVGPVIHQLGYLVNYNRNIKDLKVEVENLGRFIQEVQHRVEGAKRNAEDIEVKVIDWLNNANGILGEYNQFQENDGGANKKCFNQSCLKFLLRHQLSRGAKKLTERVLQAKEGGNFESISYCRDPQEFMSLINGENNFVNFKSRDSIKENILQALKDSNFNMIGIYGMGGVGKTELVKEILKSVKEIKLFKTVVMSTISQDPDVRKIQGEIGDMLGLRFEEESVIGRASKLLKRLQDEESILLVLDDIWKFLDLKTVGVPYKGCKILLTSRDKDVLFNEMEVKINFELNVLDNEESQNFFKKVIDIAFEENFDLESIAHEVANECGGLPIALITVAKALKGKSFAIWQDSLDQLKDSNGLNIRGMNEKVYSSLKLSYNFLEYDETKNIFLLCSMYPEDYDIGVEDDLLRYVVGMRLIGNHDTMTKARNRIIKLVDDVKSSSLLLESEMEGNYVKMHDVIRDFARSLVLKHEEISIVRNNNVKFAYCNDFDNLSRKLNSSELELLVLTSYDKHDDIPEAFFKGMDRIKVLEFEGSYISTLPSSLCSLTNIRALGLLRCTYLENIDLIKNLKGLEILNLKGSSIKELPLCTSQFTQLKVLDLSDCSNLVISSNIISRLTNLEELDLENSFNEWEGEFPNNKKEMASLSELKCLPHLEALRIQIPNEKILSEQMFSKGSKLERFRIIIGEQIPNAWISVNKALALNLKSRIVFSNDLKKLVNSAEEILLGGLIGENKVFSKFGEFHLRPQLKHLSIYENSDIDYIISEADPGLLQASTALESLSLNGMENLKSMICSYIIPREICFKMLRNIRVKDCHKMGNLLNFSLMKRLPNLQSIKVDNCEIMEGIVAMENQSDKLQLHQLKSLTLEQLPECISFCLEADWRKQLLVNDSQQSDIIEEDETSSNFKPFFSEQTEFFSFEELQIYEMYNLKMIWHDKHIVDSFGQFKRIEIVSCQNLRKVFPSSLIKTLKALEEVRVIDCDSLKEIFEINNDLSMIATEEKYDDLVKIPLRSLFLRMLPILNHVWSEDPHKIFLTFPTLEEVVIWECPKLISIFPVSFIKFNLLHKIEIDGCKSLRKIFPSNIMGAFKALEVMSIQNCESLEEIFEIDEKEITSDPGEFLVLQKLKAVQVLECPKIRNVFPASSPKYLPPQLQRLEIKCYGLEGIFKTVEKESIFHQVSLLNLEVLELECSERAIIRFFEHIKCPRLVHLELIGVRYDPLAFEKVMTKLEKSKVENMFIKEIFSENRKLAANLLRLHLENFPKLMHMSQSFQNLETLEIRRCHGFTYLLPCSVAKSLVQLERICVEDCQKITSIIGEDDETDIVFSKLAGLKLYSLPRLEGFHLGRCTLKFPCLHSIDIRECREMETFSLGKITTTPLLKEIQMFISRDTLYGVHTLVNNNINAIIRKYWEEFNHNIVQNLFQEESPWLNIFGRNFNAQRSSVMDWTEILIPWETISFISDSKKSGDKNIFAQNGNNYLEAFQDSLTRISMDNDINATIRKYLEEIN